MQTIFNIIVGLVVGALGLSWIRSHIRDYFRSG